MLQCVAGYVHGVCGVCGEGGVVLGGCVFWRRAERRGCVCGGGFFGEEEGRGLGVCVGERGEGYEKVLVSHVSNNIRSIFINKIIGFQAKMIEHYGKILVLQPLKSIGYKSKMGDMHEKNWFKSYPLKVGQVFEKKSVGFSQVGRRNRPTH